MSSKVAGEIMIPLDKYPHLPYWFTLRQAVVEIERANLLVDGRKSLPRAILIFDEKYQLLGYVRRRDILRGLEPSFLKTLSIVERKKLFDIEVDPNLIDLSAGKITKAIRKQADLKISEVMQPIIDTVNYDDHLAKVIYKMVNKNSTPFPVLQEGRVVGVIRTVDIFHEISKLLI